MSFRRSFCWLLLSAFVWADASAQSPTAAVTFLVPYAAGGSADIVARLVAAKLQERLGRAIVVENRVGGSESVATEALARSAPDGQTMALLSNAAAINETLLPNRRYDLARDLTPVARLVEIPFAILTNPSIEAKSLKELVEIAKARPGKLNYGHLGPGSPHFFSMEWLKRTAGLDIVPVPYRGAAPAYAALVSGEIQVIASGLGAATPFLESGQVRALAALSSRRPASLPNLPTIAEVGYPEFNLGSWMGVFVRSGTPKDFTDKLEAALLDAIKDPEITGRLSRLGLDAAGLDAREFAAFLQKEIANWREIVSATGSKAE